MLLYERMSLTESDNFKTKYKGCDKAFVDYISTIDPASANINFVSLNDLKYGIEEFILNHKLFSNTLFKKYIDNSKSKLKSETESCIKDIPDDCKNRNLITSDCVLAVYGSNNDYSFYNTKTGNILYYEYETNTITNRGTVEAIIKSDTKFILDINKTYGSTNESDIAGGLAVLGITAIMGVLGYIIGKCMNKEAKRKTQEVMDYITKLQEKGFSKGTDFLNPNSPKLYEYLERGIFDDKELVEFIKKNKKYYDKISKAAIFEINADGIGDANKVLAGATYIGTRFDTALWYGPNGKVYTTDIESNDTFNINIPDVGSASMTEHRLVLVEVESSYANLMAKSIWYLYVCLYNIGAVK